MLVLPSVVFAQGVFSNQASATLQQVIGDYHNHFRNIQGDLVSKEAQSADYASKVVLPGALNAVVTRYNSTNEKNNAITWKCLVTQSDDFAAVARKYRELYEQLKNAIIKVDGEKPFILNGTYEAPTDDRKFTATDFYLLPSTGSLKKLKVQLTLEYYVTEWKMALMVYDSKEEESFVMQ